MSPAPQRVRPTRRVGSFPYRWGYWLSTLMIFAGIVAAVFMVVGAARGFVDDVNAFRRVVNVDTMEINLEEGEYLVFDEDGLDLGPFDVTVLRTSDGSEIPTRELEDGATYDVDGHQGRAKVAFDVPTSDIYRVEVDTSVAEVVSFAVGTDVGNDRVNGVIRGLVVGALLIAGGLIGMMITGAVHARWKLRQHTLQYVSQARSVAEEVAAPAATDDAQRSAVEGGVKKAKDWTEQRLGQASAALSRDHGRRPVLGPSASDQAGQLIDQAQEGLAAFEATALEAAADPAIRSELGTKVSDALGRVQDRIEAGDRLRDIARDERALAGETTQELAALARSGRTQLTQAGAEAGAAAQRVAAEAAALGVDVEALTSETVDQLGAQARGLGVDVATLGSEAADDLTAEVGLAAAGAAATAALGVSDAVDAGSRRAQESLQRVLGPAYDRLDSSPLAAESEPGGLYTAPGPDEPVPGRLELPNEASAEHPLTVEPVQTETLRGESSTPEVGALAEMPQVLPPPRVAPPPMVRPLLPPPTVSAQLGHAPAKGRFEPLAPPPAAQLEFAARKPGSSARRIQPPPTSD